MNNFDYFSQVLKELAQFWKKDLPPLILRIYLKQLTILGIEEFDRAIELWSLSGKGFPTPEDLLAQVGKSPGQEGLEQWKLLTNNGKINHLTQEIAKSLNIRMELGTISYLPPKEYSYQQESIKKAFIEEYKKRWLEAIASGDQPTVEIEAVEELPEKEEIPISPEDWAKVKAQLSSIGIKLGDKPL
jgi:hypothetical protein